MLGSVLEIGDGCKLGISVGKVDGSFDSIIEGVTLSFLLGADEGAKVVIPSESDGSLDGAKLGIELNDGLTDGFIDTIGAAVHSPTS